MCLRMCTGSMWSCDQEAIMIYPLSCVLNRSYASTAQVPSRISLADFTMPLDDNDS